MKELIDNVFPYKHGDVWGDMKLLNSHRLKALLVKMCEKIECLEKKLEEKEDRRVGIDEHLKNEEPCSRCGGYHNNSCPDPR